MVPLSVKSCKVIRKLILRATLYHIRLIYKSSCAFKPRKATIRLIFSKRESKSWKKSVIRLLKLSKMQCEPGTSYETILRIQDDSGESQLHHVTRIPVDALRSKTRRELNRMLCEKKILTAEKKIQRDYRGLCDLMCVKKPPPNENPLDFLLTKWKESSSDPERECVVEEFLRFLEKIDRYDIYDDCIDMIREDCGAYMDIVNKPVIEYNPKMDEVHPDAITIEDTFSLRENGTLAHFDVLLLYDDVDIEDAMLTKEKVQGFGLKVCDRDNHFLCTTPTFELSLYTRMARRCNYTIVLLSPSFLENNVYKYFAEYILVEAIERRSKTIYLVCTRLNKELELGNLVCTMQFYRHRSYVNGMQEFWNRLRNSIAPFSQIPTAINGEPLIPSVVNKSASESESLSDSTTVSVRDNAASSLNDVSSIVSIRNSAAQIVNDVDEKVNTRSKVLRGIVKKIFPNKNKWTKKYKQAVPS